MLALPRGRLGTRSPLKKGSKVTPSAPGGAAAPDELGPLGVVVGHVTAHRDTPEYPADAAGIGKWTPKELRHSNSSLLSAAGLPMEEIV